MTIQNQILAALSVEVFDRLQPHLEVVTLKQGEVIHKRDEPLTHLYFPSSCLVSITLTMQNGVMVEVGMVGYREVAGVNAFMGSTASTQTESMIQATGDAMKIEASIVQQEFDRNGELRDLLLRQTQAWLAQVSQTACCNSLHTIEQRLPRWLLEVQARLYSDHLPLTQTYIATMLGVRRAGVTQAAQRLQEQKLIQYHRGKIQILNQAGLEAAACECFRTVQVQYAQLLGSA